MENKITVTISGQTASGKTTLASLLTWALRKFNVMPLYNSADRQKWMGLAGDEMALSQTFAAIVNGGKLPLIEIVEENEPKVDYKAQLTAMTAERDALKAELKDLAAEVVAEAVLVDRETKNE